LLIFYNYCSHVLANQLATNEGVFLIVAIIGTIAFATSGVFAAAEAGIDWLGATVLAVVVSIGGGTIRDVLIGNLPVTWVRDEWPVVVALITVAAGLIVLRLPIHIDPLNHSWYLASDAVGLGAFVVLGTSIALENGTSSFIAVFMGVITGVGGGVIRDIFTDKTPMVFVGQIYAVAGLVGATVHVLLRETSASDVVRVWVPVVVVVILRAIAIRFDVHLPRTGKSNSSPT
jgi:uncharacterized membrane protein YeiH